MVASQIFRRVRTGFAAAALIVTAVAIGIGSDDSSADAAVVPTGFTDVAVAGGLAGATDITPLGDGRALVLRENGIARLLLADGNLAAEPAFSLTVCTDSEEGLLGAAVDADFSTTGYVYLFYTRPNTTCSNPVNRVSRFVMTGNVIAAGSETVLLDNMAIPSGNHNGGDLHIGKDGYLYVSVGDAGSNKPRPQSGVATAQDLSLLNGKILRITTNGEPAPGNPFMGADDIICATAGVTAPSTGRCREIYALGLRNPYRFVMDPNTAGTRFFINDVGEGRWEEVDEGIVGANYGWNTREGFCPTGITINCSPTPAQFTEPLTAYEHADNCVYVTAGAFVPNGVWPADYDGSYLFADGGCGQMWRRTAAGSVDYSIPFASGLGQVVDMSFVRQGNVTSLFYVTNGTGLLRKITYTAGPPPSSTTTTTTTTSTSTSTTSTSMPAPTTPPTTTPTTTPAATTPPGNDGPDEIMPLVPGRLADTRSGGSTVDGQFAGTGAQVSGSTLQLVVAGRGGVEPTAGAAVLNVTATNGLAAGYVTVYPCGSKRPVASSLNYTAGATVPNAVIAKIGIAGKVCVYVSTTTDLVVDVDGSFPSSSSLTALEPARVLDSRTGFATVDGLQQGGGVRAAGSITAVLVTGRAGVPVDAAAVVANVTLTESASAGYATVYPCGQSVPLASTLNVTTGATVANLTISRIGERGTICVYTQSAAHVVVDVTGYFPSGTTYAALSPARLLETRAGRSTIDGASNGVGARAAGAVTVVQVTGRGGVLGGATTAVVNVTVTDPAAAGFVSAYPCGIEPPLASNLNFDAGQTVANAGIVRLSASGSICLFNSQATDLLVDVTGFFPG